MKTRPSSLSLPALILGVCLFSGCRAIQIQELERRVDKLESRVSAAEAKVEMLSKK